MDHQCNQKELVGPYINLGANVMGTFQSEHRGNKNCKDFCISLHIRFNNYQNTT